MRKRMITTPGTSRLKLADADLDRNGTTFSTSGTISIVSSISKLRNTVPITAPEVLPIPPMMIMPRYQMELFSVKNSGVTWPM